MSTATAITGSDLAAAKLLAALPVAALDELATGATLRRFDAGKVIFREGDEGASLFIIRKGIVKILHVGDRPDQGTLSTLGTGEVFGELAVIDPAPRSATAMAIDVTEAIEVPKENVDRVLSDYPQASRLMMGALARSLTVAKEQLAKQNEILDLKVRERTQELRETQLEVIRRLGRAAEFRDDDTGLHIYRMSRACVLLARAVGLSDRDCEVLLEAAPMHDVGKIGIPDEILLKPGRLEPEEFDIMKTHTTIGSELLSGSSSPVMQMAQVIALGHHEKWDGSGYPQGLSGEDIPLLARICAVCDVFDALISDRPYKKAWTVEEAAAEIERSAGSHFDPHLAGLFKELVPEIEKTLG